MAKEYLVQIVCKGPTDEYDQIGYLGSDDYVNYEEGEFGWDDPDECSDTMGYQAAKRKLIETIRSVPLLDDDILFGLVQV